MSSSVEVRLSGMVWCKSSEAAQNPILVICIYMWIWPIHIYIYIIWYKSMYQLLTPSEAANFGNTWTCFYIFFHSSIFMIMMPSSFTLIKSQNPTKQHNSGPVTKIAFFPSFKFTTFLSWINPPLLFRIHQKERKESKFHLTNRSHTLGND